MTNRAGATLAAACAAMLLTACGSQIAGTAGVVAGGVTTATSTPSTITTPSRPSTKPPTSSSEESTSESTSTSEETPTTESSESSGGGLADDQGAFGDTFLWTDGLELTVAPPAPYTPTDTAAADPADAYVTFEVTVTNNTPGAYDPSLFFATAQSGNAEGGQVFDTAGGLDGAPTTTLLAGRSSTFLLGFGVTDPNDIVLEVSPGYDYSSVFFLSSATPGGSPNTEMSAPEPTTTDPGADDPAKFGETYVWTDGLEVTVAPPTEFTPSEFTFAREAAAYLSFSVTIVNKTGAAYDPSSLLVSAQSGSAESEQIFDSDNGLTGSPSTSLLDGRESTFSVGFGVADPADVVLQVTPGYDYDPGFFTS